MSLVESWVPAPRRGVPRAKEGLRIDADEADAVDGCRDERADGRPVLAAEPCGLLRVQRLRVGPAQKVRMGDVDARVDDRDGPARGGGVSVSTPIAARHHSVGTSGSVKSAAASEPAGRSGSLNRSAPRARSVRDDPGGRRRRDGVERERGATSVPPGSGHEGRLGAARGGGARRASARAGARVARATPVRGRRARRATRAGETRMAQSCTRIWPRLVRRGLRLRLWQRAYVGSERISATGRRR